MKTIMVANSKGGVGKSVISRAIAVEALRRGIKAAILDIDPQRSTLAWGRRRGAEMAPTVYGGDDDVRDDLVKILNTEPVDLLVMDLGPGSLSEIADCAAFADIAIVPTRPSVDDFEAMSDAVVVLRRAGIPILAVINQAPPRSNLAETIRAALERAKVPVAKTEFELRAAYPVAAGKGLSAAELKGVAAKAARDEAISLFDEIAALLEKVKSPRAMGVLND
jgi:chromosome partitioning protein